MVHNQDVCIALPVYRYVVALLYPRVDSLGVIYSGCNICCFHMSTFTTINRFWGQIYLKLVYGGILGLSRG